MTYRSTLTATAPFAALLLLFATAASADFLSGKVVKITDGDTLYVLDTNYQQHKIRLAGIDAPERKQAYGLASRKHLASIRPAASAAICYAFAQKFRHASRSVSIGAITCEI